MTLLDIIVPGQPYRPRIRRDDHVIIKDIDGDKVVDSVTDLPVNGKEVVDSVVNIPDSSAVSDTVNSSELAPSLMNNLGVGGGDDTSILWWAIVAVLFALAVCFYFVLMYRRMLSGKR